MAYGEGGLEEFYDYKNQVMEDIVTNSTLVELLTTDTTVRQNPTQLIYKQLFPFEYVPDSLEKDYTFVCCDVDIQKSYNKTYLQPVLYIWVFTYKENLRLAAGGVRTDKVCSEISRMLNGSRMYGLGELELYSVKRFAPLENWNGKVMTFNAKDINRLSPNTKTIPANRRTGV